ncbi:MAG: isoleucine--tRNA ligase [Candidatus Omnitrophica bacterium]|nr:isoleucine--tRNA ligase [Candidatus Omnitrophota bacterium]
MDYKTTLNLPKTSFPMKADLPKREPQYLARWRDQDLHGHIRKARASGAPFILHDGPPYANGDIHIGHALNKILKDLIVRYKTMQGFNAPYVPGWDCHGMPIEHQLFKELKLTKHQIAQTEFRRKARAYAQRYVDVQRSQFQRLGVAGDWDRPYLTMAPEYELAILRVFRELVEAGYIYHGKKPVYWCASCETALAEAEVEYEDRHDTSIYVAFPVVEPPTVVPSGWRDVFQQPKRLAMAVWTTTPWTLPANVALCVHPQAKYVLLRAAGWDHDLFVAEALASRLAGVLHAGLPTTIGAIAGKELAGMRCAAPFGLPAATPAAQAGGRASVVVTDESVSMEEGTGIVHIAPGHGQEDYLIGQRYQLPVLSPVDHQGRLTTEVPEFAGQPVWEANEHIIQRLAADRRLLAQEIISHSYPHCWRCKQPVIFRATPQWFLKVDPSFRERLLKAARQVTWIPSVGLHRITGMLEHRPDWCLSRQRYWGTPIPMLHCVPCEQPLLDVAVIQQIEAALARQGVEAWFTESAQALAPDARCPTCSGAALRKETDILDVWFDSGVSHEAVLKARPELSWPAELYLEGSDQHRGWFQVSLIPSVALTGQPPYRSVLTHGFVVDGEGRKMSKSLGNVVAPQDVMQRYGADILRLWVASCDYRDDVRISEEILRQVAETYRKLRNTFRYVLANLYDFAPGEPGLTAADLPELDRWALGRAHEVLQDVTRAYDAYQFHDVVRAVYQFCVVDLSAFYLDALKDRLYTDAPTGAKRRCAQQVLYDILQLLVKILAPILVVTTEEVWDVMREAGWVREPSVHAATWPAAPTSSVTDEAFRSRWATFFAIRDVVMKALEDERSRGTIGSPLEARLTLIVSDAELQRLCETHRETLAEAFVVSEVRVELTPYERASLATGVPGLLRVRVERAAAAKCARCWKHLASVGDDAAHPELCARCAAVVGRVSTRQR